MNSPISLLYDPDSRPKSAVVARVSWRQGFGGVLDPPWGRQKCRIFPRPCFFLAPLFQLDERGEVRRVAGILRKASAVKVIINEASFTVT